MSAAATATEEKAAGLVAKGDFIWFDLMTGDIEAAQAFYNGVTGWTARDAAMPDRTYLVISAGELPLGGIMGLSGAGAKPGWIGYIAAVDVDADAARVRELGGQVHRGPEDIPGIGRFAVVSDPDGAKFCLFHGNRPAPPRIPESTVGAVAWQELHGGSLNAPWDFYEQMFGWRKAQAFEMGPNFVYQTFSTNAEQPMTGGMMPKMEGGPDPFWKFYFHVQGIQQAVDRVRAHGGSVFHGPVQVPGGRWSAQCADPQGAVFGLLSEN